MDYLMANELYIKTAPDTLLDIEVKSGFQGTYIDKEGNIQNIELSSYEQIKKIPEEVMKQLEAFGIVKRTEKKIYEKNVGFYTLNLINNELFLFNRMNNETRKYSSLKVIQEKHISLYEYLKHALVVGRKLIPLKQAMPNCIILYEYNAIALLKDLDLNIYFPISVYHPFYQNYQMGEIITEYYEKWSLYKEILEQEKRFREGPSRN